MVVWVWWHALWCACVVTGCMTLVAAVCPPCPPPPDGLHCKALVKVSGIQDQCFYKIKDHTRMFNFNTVKIEIKCMEGLTLEEPSLPRYPSPVWVPNVTLTGCPPGVGWGAALARLNVSPPERLLLMRLPARPPLRKHHFAGLDELSFLRITAVGSITIHETEASIFSPLTNLTILKLQNVRLPTAALTNINSQELSSLHLINPGLKELPLDHLCRLPKFTRLIVREKMLESLPSICNLTFLTLGPSNLRRLPPLHSIQNLSFAMEYAIRLEACTSLKSLTVTFSKARELLDGWLRDCAQLEHLKLTLNMVEKLTNQTLSGAVVLKTLNISNSKLRVLEQGFFSQTRNIEELNLSRNKLTTFPADLFSPLKNLKTLDLSNNYIRIEALGALNGLPLRKLMLTNNPLGDLCPLTEPSKFVNLLSLETLSLENTGAQRICPDWRQNLTNLQNLDLQKNNITVLTWEDLNWRPRNHNNITNVRLSENALAAIKVTEEQYNYSKKHKLADVKVKFVLDNLDKGKSLRCDCNFYWFAKAKPNLGVRFENFRCDTNTSRGSVHFDSFELGNMVCPLDVECPANCTCMVSPEVGGGLVECGRLEALPPLEGVVAGLQPGAQLVVLATGAGLHALPAALPRTLASLDLSHNRLAALPPAPARALFAAARRLHLQGNPLICDCDQPLVVHIQHHPHQVVDLENVTCADGRSVVAVIREECDAAGAVGVEAWAWALGGCGLALAAGGAALWALWPASRLRLKAFLLARGICLRWARPHDDGFKYDAFLSYAHADSAVAAELLAALEAGGLRLCVHHRDWRPGAWIPAQIIESVAESRRTVVLLSEAFVRSGWARAEFREAYARALQDERGSARLVVVVLGEAPPAGLDPEMRHYVTHNTYVRWGEPAFWDKLRAALPPAPRNENTSKAARSLATAARPQAPPAPPQTPPTPIIKFAEMDFPTPLKPLKQETSPCA